MKYRPHRGSFHDSLLEAVEIERSKAALIKHLQEHYADLIRSDLMPSINEETVTVTPRGMDVRCGWDEHLVTIEGWGVAGMTDGPCR